MDASPFPKENQTPITAVIGLGNLAHSLVPNLLRQGVMVRQVISRKIEKAENFARHWAIPVATALSGPIDSQVDLVLLTVSDAAIGSVAQRLAEETSRPDGCLFAHTSGSTPLQALAPLGEAIGVFYPLQMFTQAKEVDLQRVPIFLEGNDQIYPTLENLAQKLSPQVHPLNSAQRLRMHLGAVWVANFPNHLYRLAQRELDHAGLPLEVYRPLLSEQLHRVFELGPDQTQTGPAVRGDLPTLQKHLELLADQPDIQLLYRHLSRLINPDLPLLE